MHRMLLFVQKQANCIAAACSHHLMGINQCYWLEGFKPSNLRHTLPQITRLSLRHKCHVDFQVMKHNSNALKNVMQCLIGCQKLVTVYSVIYRRKPNIMSYVPCDWLMIIRCSCRSRFMKDNAFFQVYS